MCMAKVLPLLLTLSSLVRAQIYPGGVVNYFSGAKITFCKNRLALDERRVVGNRKAPVGLGSAGAFVEF